jgi:long-chain acyl-CoA synthetase
MLIQSFLDNSAKRLPDKVALVCGGKRFTYRQLADRADHLAQKLHELGVGRGDRVVIYLNNSPEAVAAIFGILKAGAVFVTINRTTKPEKLAAIVKDCQAVAVITDKRAVTQKIGGHLLEDSGCLRNVIVCGASTANRGNGDARFHYFPPGTAAEAVTVPTPVNIDLDLACLIYTSGTTGESKGVMCDHSNVVFVTQSIVQYLKNTEQDITLSVLPLAFSYGLYQLLAVFAVGATLVLEESFAFPDLVLEHMAEERVTGFAGVPTIYSMLLGMDLSKFDLSHLRYLTNAAAGLPVEHVKRVRQVFPRVELYLMHGLTEVARTMYLPPDQTDARPDSSGIAIPGTELWIEDEHGQRVGPGQVGELVVRGRNVMRGYWMAPELTAQRFRPGPISGERLCYSGDLFKTDEEGYFYFVSRKDDIIKSRGEKVAPREVENVLYTIRGVQDAAVIGIPDPVLGHAIKAFLVVAPGAGLTESAVISHCKAHLEDFMVPRHVEFRNELPKTGSGKIRRMDLR